ncbi:MAG: alpha/beta hydrolase [Anaerolineae bacterium]|nr:alpha/beta hydrolase [Anaerolineae bacterium]
MSAILLDSQIVHYEVLGRGRPIIFLHGWVGSWRYWISSMQVASTSFRSYALDLWGFGESARNTARYSIEHQTDLLTRFLEELGIGKVAIVGHGLGALVGFKFCTSSPKNVDRMMAVNCPMFYDSINARMRTSSLPDLVGWLGSKSEDSATALSDASKADPKAISESINSFQSNGLFGKMRQTEIPCLMVHGLSDPAIPAPPPDNSINLPKMMHHYVLDGSGHFPMIDETTRFNRLLTDFMALDSGISPRELQMKEEWKRRVR